VRTSVYADIALYIMSDISIGKLPAPNDQLRAGARKHNIQLTDNIRNDEIGEIGILIRQDLYNDQLLLPIQRHVKPQKGIALVPTEFGWVLRGAPGCRSLQSMYTNCAFTTVSPQPESSLGVYTTLAEASCVCQDLGKLF